MNAKRILIVDDDLQVLSSLETLFLSNGYHTAVAENGIRALQMIRKKMYTLVILDVIMRGMDGIEVLREIRRVSPLTEVILLSGYADTARVFEAMRTGASDYIVKPCEEEELIAKVEKTLNRVCPEGK